MPEHLSFDEFKSVTSVTGKLSFIYADSEKHSILGILPDRKLSCIKEHFQRYSLKVRRRVKTIVIDMNTHYFSLIRALFPKIYSFLFITDFTFLIFIFSFLLSDLLALS
uniref:transposase n=1 Tax=Carnobacterium TaxID=2747 RepID=UPI00344CF50B